MDAFRELGVGRDLLVGEDELRRRYDASSAERHPDAGGTREGFAELREAYGVLRSPGRRLRHWLELGEVETGGVGGLPEEVLGLFGEVGGLLRRVEEVRERKSGARSALGRSMAEREGLGLAEELEVMRGRVAAREDGLVAKFGGFQECGPQECAAEAGMVGVTLVFLEKWEAQLQEAWVGLAL